MIVNTLAWRKQRSLYTNITLYSGQQLDLWDLRRTHTGLWKTPGRLSFLNQAPSLRR